MKKLLCVLMFGMVFGQTKLESRFYSMPLNFEGDFYSEQLITDFIGSGFSKGSLQVLDLDGELLSDCTNMADIKFYHQGGDGSHNSMGLIYRGENQPIDIHPLSGDLLPNPANIKENTVIIFDISYGCNVSFNGNLNFIITADFDELNSGYIEEGFDYCIDVGANLIAYPCEQSVPILDTLPSEIASNLTGIIGQGVAATNQDGEWMGSLSGLGGGNGYWFQNNVSACFNYNCVEN